MSHRSDLEHAVDALSQAEHRTLLLDYDGTLTPIAELPSLAAPDEELLRLLAALTRHANSAVHVITGRSQETIEPWLGALPMWLHVEHGLRSRRPDGMWLPRLHEPPADFDTARAIMQRHAERTRGAFVEAKATSLAFHYRRANPFVAHESLGALRAELERYIGPEVEMLDGHKVLELRVRGVSKRSAAELALASSPANTLVLAAGDDRTDEDMFSVAPEGAVTIRVGKGATVAKLRVDSPRDVRALLSRLV